MKSSRLLVTGSNGFLGSEIIRHAIRMGLQVQGTDIHPSPNIEGYKYYQGDIRQAENLSRALTGIKSLIHTAGLAHIFDKSKALTAPYRLINAEGSASIAKMAVKMGIDHFILISSVAVYGRSVDPGDESVTCHPVGAYAESKWEAEKLAWKIAETGGMRLTILRLATLYGEEDPGNVARLMRLIDKGRFIWIGNGSNRKSLLYRGDAARACIKVLEYESSRQVQTYNVSAPSCFMRDIVNGLSEALGRYPPKWHVPERLVHIFTRRFERIPLNTGPFGSAAVTMKKWLADDAYSARLFNETFDFNTQVDLVEGLSREVSWYRKVYKA